MFEINKVEEKSIPEHNKSTIRVKSYNTKYDHNMIKIIFSIS